MPADRLLLDTVAGELAVAGFDARVFGGWAEELLGLRGPREHSDIDMLVVDPNPQDLKSFVTARSEIIEKRLSHKMAFSQGGALVELFLVHRGVTIFWDSAAHRWPSLAVVELDGLRVAAAEDVLSYRRCHSALHLAAPSQITGR